MMAQWGNDPGSPEDWAAWDDDLFGRLERDDSTGDVAGFNPSKQDMEEAAALVFGAGIPADEESIRRVAQALFDTKRTVGNTLGRHAEGDWRPDPNLTRFPSLEVPATPTHDPLPAETLLGMWAAERSPAAATRTKYAGTFRNLARVLGFDDVRRITGPDVFKYKQARDIEEKSNKTIRLDILGAGAVCAWAVTNHLLASNPFAKMVPRANKQGAVERAPFDDDDARRILTAARGEAGGMRWLPWLLCFTGARISEIVELRRKDVRREAGVWILDIVPTKLRPGKNATFQRMIPLHPAILDEGFLDYLAGLPEDPNGPLFPSIHADPRGSRVNPATTLTGRWMRNVVGIKDPAKVPNHSWRHRMEDQLRMIPHLRDEVIDAITGRHNPRNAGAGYGKGLRKMPDEVLKDLRRIPTPLPPPIVKTL